MSKHDFYLEGERVITPGVTLGAPGAKITVIYKHLNYQVWHKPGRMARASATGSTEYQPAWYRIIKVNFQYPLKPGEPVLFEGEEVQELPAGPAYARRTQQSLAVTIAYGLACTAFKEAQLAQGLGHAPLEG